MGTINVTDDCKTVADRRATLLARLQRINQEEAGTFGAHREKRIRRAFFDFARPLRQVPYLMDEAAVKAEIEVAISEFNGLSSKTPTL